MNGFQLSSLYKKVNNLRKIKLSYMGLPTPNLFSGAMNFHSKKEYVPVIALEKAVEVILNLIQIYVEKTVESK